LVDSTAEMGFPATAGMGGAAMRSGGAKINVEFWGICILLTYTLTCIEL